MFWNVLIFKVLKKVAFKTWMWRNATRLGSLKPNNQSGEEFQEERGSARAGIIYHARAWKMERNDRY